MTSTHANHLTTDQTLSLTPNTVTATSVTVASGESVIITACASVEKLTNNGDILLQVSDGSTVVLPARTSAQVGEFASLCATLKYTPTPGSYAFSLILTATGGVGTQGQVLAGTDPSDYSASIVVEVVNG